MRPLLASALAALALATCGAACQREPAPQAARTDGEQPAGATAIAEPLEGPYARSFAYVVVSVADMRQALDLWVGTFGMEIADRRTGPDPGLAAVWGLAPDAIAEQALLNTPGMIDGGVHLVRFARPGPPVREGAAPADRGPRSIDVAARDVERRHAELRAAGRELRAGIARTDDGGKPLHAARLAAHDGLTVVLLEQPGEPYPASPQGYGVTPAIVTVTADNAREAAFLQQALGLEQLAQQRLAAPQPRHSGALPAGATIDVRVLGGRDSRFGRLRLEQYVGADGRDLYPRAVPPARGMLGVTYVVPDLGPILATPHAPAITQHGTVRSILGEGRMASLVSPAGLRIDIIEK